MKVVGSDYSFITDEELSGKIVDLGKAGHLVDRFLRLFETSKQEQQKALVEVQMLRTNWIFRHKSDTASSKNDFLQLLDTQDTVDESLYTTEFVVALMHVIWTLQSKVFNWIFVPFLLQSASCLIYFSFYIQQDENDFTVVKLLIEICIYITTAFFLYLELLQVVSVGGYFYSLTNWCDLLSAPLNIVLVVRHQFFHQSWYSFH